jgi:hypothetical protein
VVPQGESMAKDYYLILGVEPDATLEQIKSAYRRQAKALHPDHCKGSSEPFRSLQEAYEVLGDTGRRQAYDDERAGRCAALRAASLRARAVEPEPLCPRRAPAEPLSPCRPRFDPQGETTWVGWHGPARALPEAQGLFQADVMLTRAQASRGGRLRLWLPLTVRCPDCDGWGSLLFSTCSRCHGQGTVSGKVPLELGFPAGIGNGDTVRVPLQSLGLAGCYLTLHFHVRY